MCKCPQPYEVIDLHTRDMQLESLEHGVCQAMLWCM